MNVLRNVVKLAGWLAVAIAVFTALQVGGGMLLTWYYVPDIVNEYSSVHVLEHKVGVSEAWWMQPLHIAVSLAITLGLRWLVGLRRR
ncbi:hypothetical protein ACFFK0_24720 [Paenibacillus chartarius]|uniref:Uncharacterized protein n=1 Tax=Paenibacillus chartarius TaxID=747481 RepID=A0ABV6DSI3_9BACL